MQSLKKVPSTSLATVVMITGSTYSFMVSGERGATAQWFSLIGLPSLWSRSSHQDIQNLLQTFLSQQVLFWFFLGDNAFRGSQVTTRLLIYLSQRYRSVHMHYLCTAKKPFSPGLRSLICQTGNHSTIHQSVKHWEFWESHMLSPSTEEEAHFIEWEQRMQRTFCSQLYNIGRGGTFLCVGAHVKAHLCGRLLTPSSLQCDRLWSTLESSFLVRALTCLPVLSTWYSWGISMCARTWAVSPHASLFSGG